MNWLLMNGLNVHTADQATRKMVERQILNLLMKL